MWHSFTHADPELALARFPDSKYGGAMVTEPTASETLMEMFNRQVEEDGMRDNLTKGQEEKLATRKQGEETKISS